MCSVERPKTMKMTIHGYTDPLETGFQFTSMEAMIFWKYRKHPLVLEGY
jgi:hypothetical protein